MRQLISLFIEKMIREFLQDMVSPYGKNSTVSMIVIGILVLKLLPDLNCRAIVGYQTKSVQFTMIECL